MGGDFCYNKRMNKIKPVGKWKQIFAPSEVSKYVNDHTIFLDRSGRYRLIGTTSSKDYAFFRERFFIEAVSDTIDGKYRETAAIFKNEPHLGVKISPFVFFSEEDNLFHLYFGPGKISHYISMDGTNWSYQGIAIKTIWPLTRDPFVIRWNDKYLMYLTGSNNRIIAYESTDLTKWNFVGSPLRLGFGAPRSLNSACESPTVLAHKDKYYLFTTITPALVGTKNHYNNTLVFCSDSPLDFGQYSTKDGSGQNVVGRLDAHAPEIFLDQDKIFYTTCGWAHMPKPKGVSDNGVFIREMKIS